MILTSPEFPVRVQLPPHVWKTRNRAGRDYYYLTPHRGTERQGATIRLPDDPRSPEFWAEYARLMKLPAAVISTTTVRALDRAWGGTWDKAKKVDVDASPEWTALGDRTKVEWRRHRARVVAAWGDLEARGIEPKHVLALRDAWADSIANANNLMRCLSSMMSWSVPRGWRTDNPCREIKVLKCGGDGYAPWPWEVIVAAEEELTAKGRVDLWWAVALAFYTGQRLGDCLAMRWSAIDTQGRIRVRQGKTRKTLLIQIHSRLAPILATIPRTAVTILTSTDGTPWQAFQTPWQKHKPTLVAENGLVFHGLRKSAVVTLLEAGCTDAEVAAVTGQSRQMIEHYARQVNQAKLGAAAVLKWEQSGT